MRKKRELMMKDVPLRAPAKGAGCGSLMRCSKRIQSLTSRSTSMNTAASVSGIETLFRLRYAPRNRSSSPEKRSPVRLFLTANPRAFFCPMSTTIFLPRVIAV
jgi:hypothetical protein